MQEMTATVSIDYIRLATFDFQDYLAVVEKIRQTWIGGWRPKKWLQYKCQIHSDTGIMYGIGEQQGKGHAIIQVSGSTAQVFFHSFLKKIPPCQLRSFYCTRLDLQNTLPPHPETDYHKLFTKIREPKQLILGSTGNTLYIGNRTSATFWRMYDKTDTGQVRLEVELKAEQAKRAWVELLRKRDIAGIYARYLQKSRVPSVIADYYREDIVSATMPAETQIEDIQKKLEWLRTLDSLVYKLANDHDTHEKTTELINRWTEYCAKS
jgi:hypothetical protein